MEIAVVGAGHVGLVSAACLVAVGHVVRVQDIDEARIETLLAGGSPFYEPHLEDLLATGVADGRLSFRRDPREALSGARLVFLCVNTPNLPDGHVDLSAVTEASGVAAAHADDGAVIVNRSTAPVGTAAYVRSAVEEVRGGALRVAVNPEFLAEGSAVQDFLVPDRLVVGAWDPAEAEPVLEAYEPIVDRRLTEDVPADVRRRVPEGAERVPVVVTSPPTAELIKYAANAFLAMKISFINEAAWIAEEVGADVTKVAQAIGLDRRIGPSFLRAGIGWGGSCFPKDIVALQGMAETRGLSARMLRAANEVNADQHRWVARKLQRHLKTLVGKRVGLLGLTFKPDTDDLRNAPALEIAADLARLAVRVRAYDPAIKQLPPDLEGTLELAESPLDLARDAEALVLVTEWAEFADLDLSELAGAMREPLLLDGRNFFDPDTARAAGFTYVSVGR